MLYKDLYINIVTTVDSGSPPPFIHKYNRSSIQIF